MLKATVPAERFYDFVVIGAGYTGIAAARRLAELNTNASILVVEATEVGEGASGRNSGFILTVPFLTSHSSRSDHTSAVDVARKQMRIYDSSLIWLKAIVDEFQISCDWQEVDKYHAAATDKGATGLKILSQHYQQWGVKSSEIAPAELADRIGSSYYRFALQTDRNVFVQPAALIRGLADALPANVELVENTPVLSVTRGQPFSVELSGKTVRAGNLILANNGFARNLGFFRSRVFNVFTYAGLTPELDDDELSAHGTQANWGVTPAARAGTTLRRPLGRRFLVRSLHSYEDEEASASVRDKLEDSYRRRYPNLRQHKFEFVWGGVMGLTRNAQSCFGQVAENVFAAVGCNGAGIMKGTAFGKLLAEKILGLDSDELRDVEVMNSPTWLPPDPFLRWGVTLEMQRMRKLAGAER